MLLNRTVRTLSANSFGLNLGTRSTAANAVVVNGKTLRNRPNLLQLLGMQEHPMRAEIVDKAEGRPIPAGKPGLKSISGSPSLPFSRPSFGLSTASQGVVVARAEVSPAETWVVVDDDRDCRADRRHRQAESGHEQRQDRLSRRSPRLTGASRQPLSTWRAYPPTSRRLAAAARTGLALG